MSKIAKDLRDIEAILFDVDGVLSHQTITIDEVGTPIRTVNVRDGFAIKCAAESGITLGIISGGSSDSIPKRFAPLGIRHIHMQVSDKTACFREFIKATGIPADKIIFCGDDIPDIEVMQACGFAVVPNDAAVEAKEVADYISPVNGGDGVARDIIEEVLKMKLGPKWWSNSSAKW